MMPGIPRLAGMAEASTSDWQRVENREDFVDAFAEALLAGEGIRFVIHADGRIRGHVDGLRLSGTWFWSDGYFCRTVALDGEDLGLDCEIIERRGAQMRYTRDRGNGAASIVEISDDGRPWPT